MIYDSLHAPYVHKSEELKTILAFICSLGDDALLDWIKGLVRFPHPEPDQNPLFMSGEPACGKYTLVKLIRTMIGSENLVEVGGRSGKGIVLACLSQCTLLVNFAEFEFDGWARHKGLKFILNEQAHRVLITSNDPPPENFILGLKRRPIHIRCGNGLVGNKLIFEDLHRLMEDRDVIHTFWDYLKKGRWGWIRHKFRIRAIVLYWLKLTEPLMKPGNAAFARDHAEHEAMWE
jgi:hypothetical protein